MKPYCLAAGVLAVSFSFAGCGDRKSPSEQVEEGLKQAREGIEQAHDSMEDMRKRSEELREELVQQKSQLDALIEKRLTLLEQDVEALRQRLSRLPAETETALRPKLAQLDQQLAEMRVNFTGYRDAAPPRSEEMRRKLNDALKKFDELYAQFQRELSVPGFAAEPPPSTPEPPSTPVEPVPPAAPPDGL